MAKLTRRLVNAMRLDESDEQALPGGRGSAGPDWGVGCRVWGVGFPTGASRRNVRFKGEGDRHRPRERRPWLADCARAFAMTASTVGPATRRAVDGKSPSRYGTPHRS